MMTKWGKGPMQGKNGKATKRINYCYKWKVQNKEINGGINPPAATTPPKKNAINDDQTLTKSKN